MSSITLKWQADGSVESFSIFRAEQTIDPDHLPAPIATGVTEKSYVDDSIVDQKQYFYRVASVKKSQQKLSDEISLMASTFWTPSNLGTSADLWVDYNHVVTDSGGRISQATDLSKNAYHLTQSQPSAQPLLANGSMSFDGADDFLASADAAKIGRNATSLSVFIVFAKRGLNTTTRNNNGFSIPDSNEVRFALQTSNSISSNGIASFYKVDNINSANGAVWSDLTTLQSNVFSMLYVSIDLKTKRQKFYQDGKLVKDMAISTSASNFPNVSEGARKLFLGCSDVSYSSGFADIAVKNLILQSNNDFNESEINKLFGWAAHQYQLTDNLPADHPFKNTAPFN